MTRRKLIALILVFNVIVARAQEEFVPIPRERQAVYHFNFARNFFPSPQAEQQGRKQVYDLLKKLEALKGKVGANAENLQRALALNDELNLLVMRHIVYLYLQSNCGLGPARPSCRPR